MPKAILPENVLITEVKHAIENLKSVCQKNKLPMFVTVYIPEKQKYVSDILSPTVLNVKVLDDRIIEHLNVADGMRTIRPDPLPRLGIDENRNMYVMTKEESDAFDRECEEYYSEHDEEGDDFDEDEDDE